jgi:hypothetical protein
MLDKIGVVFFGGCILVIASCILSVAVLAGVLFFKDLINIYF